LGKAKIFLCLSAIIEKALTHTLNFVVFKARHQPQSGLKSTRYKFPSRGRAKYMQLMLQQKIGQ